MLVDDIKDDRVLDVPEDVQRNVFDSSVLSLCHEARDTLTQPIHSIQNMMHVVEFGFYSGV